MGITGVGTAGIDCHRRQPCVRSVERSSSPCIPGIAVWLPSVGVGEETVVLCLRLCSGGWGSPSQDCFQRKGSKGETKFSCCSPKSSFRGSSIPEVGVKPVFTERPSPQSVRRKASPLLGKEAKSHPNTCVLCPAPLDLIPLFCPLQSHPPRLYCVLSPGNTAWPIMQPGL